MRETDEDRSHANQLVFAAVGWICMFNVIKLFLLDSRLTSFTPPGVLFPPAPHPKPNYLEIINPVTSERPEQQTTLRQKNTTFTNHRQDMDQKDEALHKLLGRLGKVLPPYHEDLFAGPQEPPPPGQDNMSIDLGLVCFQTLHKVASIEIELVDCISLHLEFNIGTHTLKIFRFPSVCLVMACNPKKSLLSQ